MSTNTNILAQLDALTPRQQAAIALRIPNSGDAEIDALISQSAIQEKAAAILAGLVQHYGLGGPSGTVEADWAVMRSLVDSSIVLARTQLHWDE